MIEVEGDAVFVHHAGEDLNGGEAMSVVERCYLAFAQRRDMIRLGSTCSCRACRSIDSLDLKFVVHHGRYVCRSVAGAKKLVGADVVVVHRLLKNAVSEALGTRAYALFTDAASAGLGLDVTAEGLVPVELAYDDVGVLSVWVRDLGPFLGTPDRSAQAPSLDRGVDRDRAERPCWGAGAWVAWPTASTASTPWSTSSWTGSPAAT